MIAPTPFSIFLADLITCIAALQHADDCAIIAAHAEGGLRNTLDAFAESYKVLGLVINAAKTKYIFLLLLLLGHFASSGVAEKS